MQMGYRNIIINSSVAFVIASIIEMTLHEAGHFIAATCFHGSPTLFHNSVNYGDLQSNEQRIVCAIAGPVVSLCIGFLAHYILHRQLFRGIPSLLCIYLSIFGYVGFFGYITIAPFFNYGDTGYVLRAIECPLYLIIVFALVSVFITFLIMKSLSIYLIGMMNNETGQNGKQRNKFIRMLVLYPLFIGIAITTLLNFPVPTVLSLIAPLTSPYVILWPYYYYLKTHVVYTDEKQSISKKIGYKWMAVLLIAVVINRLLVMGLHF